MPRQRCDDGYSEIHWQNVYHFLNYFLTGNKKGTDIGIKLLYDHWPQSTLYVMWVCFLHSITFIYLGNINFCEGIKWHMNYLLTVHVQSCFPAFSTIPISLFLTPQIFRSLFSTLFLLAFSMYVVFPKRLCVHTSLGKWSASVLSSCSICGMRILYAI